MTPNLLVDITLIPQKLGGLAALTRGIAVAVLAFMIPFTLLEMNVKASGAQSPREYPTYQGFAVRLLMVAVCLLAYGRIFHFILRVSQLMSCAVLSEQAWGGFLTMTLKGSDSRLPTLSILVNSATSIQSMVLFLSSLAAVTSRDMIVMLQGCFLSLLFAFGPIAIACGIGERSGQITKGWLTNTIQVASWSFFLRLVVRVWLNLGPLAGVMDRGMANDFLGMFVVNVTFLVMVLGTPFIAARLLSGGNLAVFGATAFAAGQAAVAAKTIGMSRFVSREAVQIARAPESERTSFFYHPLAATATAVYRRTFERYSEPDRSEAPANGAERDTSKPNADSRPKGAGHS
ncbi:MAG: hypothetical protein ABIJ96_01610 [Elusimicrobiota bacterium]